MTDDVRDPDTTSEDAIDWYDREYGTVDGEPDDADPAELGSRPTPIDGAGGRAVVCAGRPSHRAPAGGLVAAAVDQRAGGPRFVVTVVDPGHLHVIMMMIVHLNPFSPSRDLVFDQTTPTGGDMGAHVWAPAYLRDHLLPNFELSGWTMDWYGGLPLYRFYMVIPALAIVALDVVLPYGVAFKLVAVAGLVLFPLACWTFGRLANFRHPIPELFAIGGLCFLLDESFQIYGGNVKSTMAGEYSFSIALTLAMFGLGLLAAGLRTGKYRVSAAIVLSLAAVSHGIVLIFVAVSAIILCLVWLDRWRLVYAVTTGVTTLLLSAWWVGPFLFGHEFMTDMKYGFRPEGASDSFYDMFFPLTAPLDFIITALAIIGFIAMIMRRNLTGTAIGLIAITFVGLVYLTRDSLPASGCSGTRACSRSST